MTTGIQENKEATKFLLDCINEKSDPHNTVPKLVLEDNLGDDTEDFDDLDFLLSSEDDDAQKSLGAQEFAIFGSTLLDTETDDKLDPIVEACKEKNDLRWKVGESSIETDEVEGLQLYSTNLNDKSKNFTDDDRTDMHCHIPTSFIVAEDSSKAIATMNKSSFVAQCEKEDISNICATSLSSSSNIAGTIASTGPEIMTVSLMKNSDGFGLKFGGPKTRNAATAHGMAGIYLTEPKRGSIADQNEAIQVGMQVVSINDTDTSQFTIADLKPLSASFGDTVTLKICKNDELLRVYGKPIQSGSANANSTIATTTDIIAVSEADNSQSAVKNNATVVTPLMSVTQVKSANEDINNDGDVDNNETDEDVEESPACAECAAPEGTAGAYDESDGNFYCSSCWDEFDAKDEMLNGQSTMECGDEQLQSHPAEANLQPLNASSPTSVTAARKPSCLGTLIELNKSVSAENLLKLTATITTPAKSKDSELSDTSSADDRIIPPIPPPRPSLNVNGAIPHLSNKSRPILSVMDNALSSLTLDDVFNTVSEKKEKEPRPPSLPPPRSSMSNKLSLDADGLPLSEERPTLPPRNAKMKRALQSSLEGVSQADLRQIVLGTACSSTLSEAAQQLLTRKTGVLQREVGKKWKKMYFLLNDTILRISKSAKAPPNEYFNITEKTRVKKRGSRTLCVFFPEQGCRCNLQARTGSDADEWLTVLQNATRIARLHRKLTA